jgi:hypothetical protein
MEHQWQDAVVFDISAAFGFVSANRQFAQRICGASLVSDGREGSLNGIYAKISARAKH